MPSTSPDCARSRALDCERLSLDVFGRPAAFADDIRLDLFREAARRYANRRRHAMGVNHRRP